MKYIFCIIRKLYNKVKISFLKLILNSNNFQLYSLRASLYARFLTENLQLDTHIKLVDSLPFFNTNNLETTTSPDYKRLMVFAPHQDDDIIGCGGTILNSIKNKAEIQVTYIMDGAPPKFHGSQRTEYVNTRNIEAINVWKTINNSTPIFLETPTRGIAIDPQTVITKIQDVISKYDPDCIFVPYFLETPLDHRRSSYVIWQALQNIKHNIKQIWCYQVTTMISPNIAVDISDVEQNKFALMNLWESQNKLFNYAHRTRGLNAANSVYTKQLSSLKNTPYVELFHVLTPKEYSQLLQHHYANTNLFG
ncbi:MAG TPA: hypothetical protein DEZ08_04980 [Dehalococcoidia bacterium]|nr:hypothetical protein [Dehalococcoidia bacterium]